MRTRCLEYRYPSSRPCARHNFDSRLPCHDSAHSGLTFAYAHHLRGSDRAVARAPSSPHHTRPRRSTHAPHAHALRFFLRCGYDSSSGVAPPRPLHAHCPRPHHTRGVAGDSSHVHPPQTGSPPGRRSPQPHRRGVWWQGDGTRSEERDVRRCAAGSHASPIASAPRPPTCFRSPHLRHSRRRRSQCNAAPFPPCGLRCGWPPNTPRRRRG